MPPVIQYKMAGPMSKPRSRPEKRKFKIKGWNKIPYMSDYMLESWRHRDYKSPTNTERSPVPLECEL